MNERDGTNEYREVISSGADVKKEIYSQTEDAVLKTMIHYFKDEYLSDSSGDYDEYASGRTCRKTAEKDSSRRKVDQTRFSSNDALLFNGRETQPERADYKSV